MSGPSSIEWTEHTWNPVRGCSRVSPGCEHCYAERFESRGLTSQRSPTTGEAFAIFRPGGPHWTGRVELIPEMLNVPLKRKKPTMYFVNSMSDLFHEKLTAKEIYRVFAVMEQASWHTFQILTKRAALMLEVMREIYGSANMGYVLPNVWLGVSVENQKYADERIPLLLQTPAAVRFISAEPLLGPIDFKRLKMGNDLRLVNLDWVIVGGESGPRARPCDIAWIRSIRDQCKAANVPCFVKQLGSHIVASGNTCFGWPINEVSGLWSDCRVDPPRIHVPNKKGGKMEEWPEDLRVREIPRK